MLYFQIDSDFDFLHPNKQTVFLDKLDEFETHMVESVFPYFLGLKDDKIKKKHKRVANDIKSTFETLIEKQNSITPSMC